MLTYSNVIPILYEACVLDPQDAYPSPRALDDQGNVTAINRDEGGTTLWSVRDVPQVRAVFAEKK